MLLFTGKLYRENPTIKVTLYLEVSSRRSAGMKALFVTLIMSPTTTCTSVCREGTAEYDAWKYGAWKYGEVYVRESVCTGKWK